MHESTSFGSDLDMDYLTCVSRLAESLQGEAYLEIAQAVALQYVEAGQLEQAVEHAEQIHDAYTRDSVIAVIAGKAVASGNEDYATELLETIEDPVLQNSAIEQISIEFARRGEFDTALGFTDQLSDYDSAFSSLATIYWQSGHKNEAIDLARSIEFAQQRATTLVQLARLSDDKDESLSLLGEARAVTEEIEQGELKVFALMAIASAYEEHADRESSLEALNRALEACNDFESAHLVGLSGNFAKDETLLQILEGFLRLEDLSTATEVTDEIEDEFIFARANLSLAVARGKGHAPSEAAEHLNEVKAMVFESQAYSEQEAAVRDGLIVDLAVAYANCTDYAEARRIIHSVASQETRGSALKELGKLCGRAGHDREVSEIEADLPSSYDKSQYWLGIYDSMNPKESDLSERAMAKALARAEGIERPLEKAQAFTQIAHRFAKSDGPIQVEKFFLAATSAATLIEGNFLKARALLLLAKASQDTGRKPNRDEQRLLEAIVARLD